MPACLYGGHWGVGCHMHAAACALIHMPLRYAARQLDAALPSPVLSESCFTALWAGLCVLARCADAAQRELVVGGGAATTSQFPFMASLQDITLLVPHFCGGVMIDAQHVLTSASCVAGRVEANGVQPPRRAGPHNAIHVCRRELHVRCHSSAVLPAPAFVTACCDCMARRLRCVSCVVSRRRSVKSIFVSPDPLRNAPQ
jgi:hypothetical protein